MGAIGGVAVAVAGGDEVAVHVPFEIGDRVRAQQCVELGENALGDLRPGQIEDELMARGPQRSALDMQHGVGMGAIQVAVRIDHLRLDPEPELQAHAGDRVDQRTQAMRIFFRVGPPVAEARAGIVAAGHPAVIEHETFDPETHGCARLRQQPVMVVVEIIALPGVQRHRAGTHRPSGQRST